MTVTQLRPASAATNETNLEPQRLACSFDISQPDANGFVLIDACVPMPLAVEFMKLLNAYMG